MNERAVLDTLLAQGPTSATGLSTLVGVSKPTSYKALARLVATGIVEEIDGDSGKCGPDGKFYRINAGGGYGAGLHITPQRVTARVADAVGTVCGEAAEPVSAEQPSPFVTAGLRALERAAAAADLHTTDIGHVVIGVPGTVHPRTGRPVPWADPGSLQVLDFSVGFDAHLGGRLEFESTANLAAVAERRCAAMTGCDSYVLLWLEDRPRLAIMAAGNLYRGVTGRAGDAWTSGDWPGLADAGLTPTAASEALAPGLAAVSALIDPERVVVAGSLPTVVGDELCVLLQRALDKDLALPPRVVLSSLPGDAVLAGAVDSALVCVRETLWSRSSPCPVQNAT
ncbi:ROK family protein [Streptomyces prunicolor]